MERGSRIVCTAPTPMDILRGRPWQRSGPQHLFTLLCVAETRDKCSKLVKLPSTLSCWPIGFCCACVVKAGCERRMDLLPVVVVEETKLCAEPHTHTHTLEPFLKHYSKIIGTHFASMYFGNLDLSLSLASISRGLRSGHEDSTHSTLLATICYCRSQRRSQEAVAASCWKEHSQTEPMFSWSNLSAASEPVATQRWTKDRSFEVFRSVSQTLICWHVTNGYKCEDCCSNARGCCVRQSKHTSSCLLVCLCR